jgi:predicted alpha-1,6-mannanase (GH76 family)
MKNILGIAVLAGIVASTFASCDNVDEYVAPTGYTIDWSAAADSSTTAFIQNFWNADKGFFNASSTGYKGENNNYWPQAHAMNVIIDAYERTGDTKYSAMFDTWFTGILQQCWSGSNDYRVPLYDDNAWISLTMMRLYNHTKDTKYLEVAKRLQADMMTSWNYNGVGGLTWGDPNNSAYGGPNNQATPTNGPACLLCFKLYEATGDESYAQDGMRIYEFLREYILDPATGRVLNGIDGQTLLSEGEASRVYSYNQGTVMASAYAAYKYTGSELYLKDARRIAQYAVCNACVESSTNILHYENYSWRWDDASGDVTLFRAILFQYLGELIEAPELPAAWRTKFLAAFNTTADYLWRSGVIDKSSYSYIMYNSNFSLGVEPGAEGYLNPNVTGATLIEMRARLAADGY